MRKKRGVLKGQPRRPKGTTRPVVQEEKNEYGWGSATLAEMRAQVARREVSTGEVVTEPPSPEEHWRGLPIREEDFPVDRELELPVAKRGFWFNPLVLFWEVIVSPRDDGLEVNFSFFSLFTIRKATFLTAIREARSHEPLLYKLLGVARFDFATAGERSDVPDNILLLVGGDRWYDEDKEKWVHGAAAMCSRINYAREIAAAWRDEHKSRIKERIKGRVGK